MKRLLLMLILIGLPVLASAQTNTATQTATNTATSTATDSATNTATNSPTVTNTPTPIPSYVPGLATENTLRKLTTGSVFPIPVFPGQLVSSPTPNIVHFAGTTSNSTPVAMIPTVTAKHTNIYGLTLTNSSGSAARVIIKDGAVTAYDHTLASTNGGEAVPYFLPAVLPSTSWSLINSGAVTSIEYSGWYRKDP